MNTDKSDQASKEEAQSDDASTEPVAGDVSALRGKQAAEHEHLNIPVLVHDLRNLVAPIHNAVHLLRLRSAADGELRAVAEMIERQINGMGRILDTLADAYQLMRGELTLALTPLDAREVVNDALRAARPLIEGRKQRLHVSLPAVPVRVQADARRLTHVISTLLENAAKHTSQDEDIWLDAALVDNQLQISVRDNGGGIPAEHLSSIFDFFAADQRSGDSRSRGLRVDLASAYKLIELHQGTLTAASMGANQGSRFVVRLPIVTVTEQSASSEGNREPPVPQSSTPGSGAAVDQPKRVLIADDNNALRISLSGILQEMGHSVKTAADGVEALAIAGEWMPNCVLIDINMPKLNGFEVARTLRSQHPSRSMQLIMMSGDALDEAAASRAKRAGFDQCIDKIHDFERLEEILRKNAG